MKLEIELDEVLSESLASQAHHDRRDVKDFVVMILDRWAFGILGRDHQPVTQEELDAYRAERGRTPPRKYVKAKVRDAIFERDGGRCQHCGGSISRLHEAWHLDHVIPVSKGGSDDPLNLVLSCARCNLEKSNKVPA